jgi:hypothetical protein
LHAVHQTKAPQVLPARHKALTGITAFGAIIVIGTVANAASGTKKTRRGHHGGKGVQ